MRLDCNFIAGCNGFHRVSHRAIPQTLRHEHEKTDPFGWLGILSQTPPRNKAHLYANSRRRFARCSLQNPFLLRNWIQCDASDCAGNRTDDGFLTQLKRHMPGEQVAQLATGPSIKT